MTPVALFHPDAAEARPRIGDTFVDGSGLPVEVAAMWQLGVVASSAEGLSFHLTWDQFHRLYTPTTPPPGGSEDERHGAGLPWGGGRP